MSRFLRRKSKDEVGSNNSRFSVIGAKKKVASKVGESKVGRTTLIKVLGEQADDIVSALKESVTIFESREKAKQLKKDTFKWVLKASLLHKEKKITKNEIRHLHRPVQLFAERFLFLFDTYETGNRKVESLVSEAADISKLLENLFMNFAQEKNVSKLTEVVAYYGSEAFLKALLNEKKYETQLIRICSNIRTILLPFPTMFDDEKSAMDAFERAEVCYQAIQPELSNFMGDYPTIAGVFDDFMRKYQGGKMLVTYQLVLALRAYRSLNTRSLRLSRGSQILTKYTTHGLHALPEGVANQLNALEPDGRIATFDPILEQLERCLDRIFHEQFLNTSEYRAFRQGYETEFNELKERFGDIWSTKLKASTLRHMHDEEQKNM